MPENALAGGEEDIGGNKPADFGVIVPALEVVEAGFLIIDIPTVTEGIILSECGRKWARGWQQFAPNVSSHKAQNASLNFECSRNIYIAQAIYYVLYAKKIAVGIPRHLAV